MEVAVNSPLGIFAPSYPLDLLRSRPPTPRPSIFFRGNMAGAETDVNAARNWKQENLSII